MENKELKNALLRKFHVQLRTAGINIEGKRLMLSTYKVEHSNELTVEQLDEICGKLEELLNPRIDKWRKRVIASIGAWLRIVHTRHTLVDIMAIACRATGYNRFNAIPESRLRNVYYEFLNKQKDSMRTKRATSYYMPIVKKNIELN